MKTFTKQTAAAAEIDLSFVSYITIHADFVLAFDDANQLLFAVKGTSSYLYRFIVSCSSRGINIL